MARAKMQERMMYPNRFDQSRPTEINQQQLVPSGSRALQEVTAASRALQPAQPDIYKLQVHFIFYFSYF